jgi:hypothetical protein
MRDPYLAGWNAAIEAAAVVADNEMKGFSLPLSKAAAFGIAKRIRALAKPEPIPDDHWRRVNDGDWDYDPPRKEPTRD